jgi:hypothetical protein
MKLYIICVSLSVLFFPKRNSNYCYAFDRLSYLNFFYFLQRRQQSITLHHQQNATGRADAVPDRGPDVYRPSGLAQLLQGPLLRHNAAHSAGDETSRKGHGKIRLRRQCKL